METVAVWAFFIFWGGALIQSLLHGKLTLAFNLVFQMYVVREFVVGNVDVAWKPGLWAIFSCWLVMILSCIPGAIVRARRQARWEREAKGGLTTET
jgi:hypothetical protein